MTIKEIARALNVSTATVSNVIHGHLEKMSPETAQLIREKIIDPMLEKDPKADFILMGDMNDNYNNMPIQTLIGTRTAHPRMVDSRPIEANGDTLPENRTRGRFRSVAWTHFYSTEDS